MSLPKAAATRSGFSFEVGTGEPAGRAASWFALGTAAVTLWLIALGGLVTSHGVGMAVPDWPNTYDYNMFFFPVSQWVGGIFYEHTHRLLASAVGMMTGILALWLHGAAARKVMQVIGGFLMLGSAATWFFAHRGADAAVLGLTGTALLIASLYWPSGRGAASHLKKLGVVAFIAVVLQGVLGGLRVTAMKDEIGIFHATLAQAFFALLCVIALLSSRWFIFTAERWKTGLLPEAGKARTILLFCGATTGLVLLQLILGATMRHQHAGLAIPDFPLAYGKLWPDTSPVAVETYNQRRLEVLAVNQITAGQIHLQMLHRILALIIVGAVVSCALLLARTTNTPRLLRNMCYGWVFLIIAQGCLGVFTIWSNKAADIATSHVVLGALALATGTILSIVSIRLWSLARRQAGAQCNSRFDKPETITQQPVGTGYKYA